MVTYSRFGIESIAASGLATFRKPLRFLSSTRQRTLVIRASKRPGRNALSPLHSINKICQKLVSCREEAPPESRSQGNQSLALLLSGAILTCWPYPVEAGDGSSHPLTIERELLEGLLLENAQSRIHILSDSDLVQLFRDVVSSKAPALSVEETIPRAKVPNPLTSLTKPFRPERFEDRRERSQTEPGDELIQNWKSGNETPSDEKNASVAASKTLPAAGTGDQAVGNKARQETGQQISESKSRKPADEALSDVKKMEDSSEQPDFTNDLLEKSGLTFPNEAVKGSPGQAPESNDNKAFKNALRMVQAFGEAIVGSFVALQQSDTLVPSLSLAGLVGLMYIFFKYVASEDEEEEEEERKSNGDLKAPDSPLPPSLGRSPPSNAASEPMPASSVPILPVTSLPMRLETNPISAVAKVLGQWPPLFSLGKGQGKNSDAESSNSEALAPGAISENRTAPRINADFGQSTRSAENKDAGQQATYSRRPLSQQQDRMGATAKNPAVDRERQVQPSARQGSQRPKDIPLSETPQNPSSVPNGSTGNGVIWKRKVPIQGKRAEANQSQQLPQEDFRGNDLDGSFSPDEEVFPFDDFNRPYSQPRPPPGQQQQVRPQFRKRPSYIEPPAPPWLREPSSLAPKSRVDLPFPGTSGRQRADIGSERMPYQAEDGSFTREKLRDDIRGLPRERRGGSDLSTSFNSWEDSSFRRQSVPRAAANTQAAGMQQPPGTAQTTLDRRQRQVGYSAHEDKRDTLPYQAAAPSYQDSTSNSAQRLPKEQPMGSSRRHDTFASAEDSSVEDSADKSAEIFNQASQTGWSLKKQADMIRNGENLIFTRNDRFWHPQVHELLQDLGTKALGPKPSEPSSSVTSMKGQAGNSRLGDGPLGLSAASPDTVKASSPLAPDQPLQQRNPDPEIESAGVSKSNYETENSPAVLRSMNSKADSPDHGGDSKLGGDVQCSTNLINKGPEGYDSGTGRSLTEQPSVENNGRLDSCDAQAEVANNVLPAKESISAMRDPGNTSPSKGVWESQDRRANLNYSPLKLPLRAMSDSSASSEDEGFPRQRHREAFRRRRLRSCRNGRSSQRKSM